MICMAQGPKSVIVFLYERCWCTAIVLIRGTHSPLENGNALMEPVLQCSVCVWLMESIVHKIAHKLAVDGFSVRCGSGAWFHHDTKRPFHIRMYVCTVLYCTVSRLSHVATYLPRYNNPAPMEMACESEEMSDGW